jgi:hypothetical protein
MQLNANIFGLPAARPHDYETSGLNAAIDTAVKNRLDGRWAAYRHHAFILFPTEA